MDWARLQPAQASPYCTKCNSPPISGQCTNLGIAVKLYNGPLLSGFNVLNAEQGHKVTVYYTCKDFTKVHTIVKLVY